MKFRWVPNSYGRSGIVATAESVDSQPVLSELWMDYNIDLFDQDRFSVACALAFGPSTNQRMAFSAGVSHRVSTEIERYLAGSRVRVEPVTYEERSVPTGNSLLLLHDQQMAVTAMNAVGAERHFALEILPSDRFSGGMLQMDRLSLSSNAWLLVDQPPGGLRSHPHLAAAVLLAADLSASAIKVISSSSIADPLMRDVARLLRSTGLSLVYGER